MPTFNYHINLLATFIVVLTALLIIFKSPRSQMKVALLFFLVCVISYLIIGEIPQGPIRNVLLYGPFLLPFSFWALSRSMFSDKVMSWLAYFLYATIVASIQYIFYFINSSTQDYQQIISLVSRSISLLFVLLAIYEAQKQRKEDLIEKRRKMRTLFTYFVGTTVILTLFVELGLRNADHEIPRLLQRSSILLFSLYFLIKNVTFTTEFLAEKPKEPVITNPELVDQIQSEVIENSLYRKEALTIKLLAEKIDQHEYKVRQAINQQLGYRNFTDFINSFRIQEAKSILSDPSQKEVTVLEVAYKTGFNSIGPFNRAFKSDTKQTPTEFRRTSLGL